MLAVGGAPAASASKRLAVHEAPTVSRLIVRGDRVVIAYIVDSRGVRSATGMLFVHNDLQSRYTRLPLRLTTDPANGTSPELEAQVPTRLIRGHELLYFAVMHDPATGRSASLPSGGSADPEVAWILQRPVVVR